MGLIRRMRQRMRRPSFGAKRGDKDSLTIVSTCEESYWSDSGTEEVYILVADEPSSSDEEDMVSNNPTTTTKPPKPPAQGSANAASPSTSHFFERKEKRVKRYQDRDMHQTGSSNVFYNLESCCLEDERDDVGLLSTSREECEDCSQYSAYSFSQLEEEPIFEPSFEIAIVDRPQIDKEEENETKDSDNTTSEEIASSSVGSKSHKTKMSSPTSLKLGRPLPQRRYDSRGRPFLHIFHDGLSTLYEETGGESDNYSFTTSIQTLSSMQPKTSVRSTAVISVLSKETSDNGLLLSDDAKIRARWDYALALMKNVGTCEWEHVLQLSHHSHSTCTAVEI